ncbi:MULTISPECIES: hypothetical protein [unclassified Streptomyces]|uniref:hypothetical protein n=1 Tax=unclassified Streptomyces TaxID=2593676 RepID=UPI002E81287E|nr:hypothetical protein [Streptomyces sp. NBC_00589]WTI37782.1 hypothetical protein OIC96_23625 [Streptomyces sp. NBC_00775]WUB28539.1 hypothetical protein OHA51_26110 [Streptomyces sp. NBC_00589]
MNRPSSCLLASALTAGMLLSTAACSNGGGDSGSGHTEVSASALAKESPAKSPSVSATPALTEAQAQSALITNTDLGSQWTETQGAATWRDALLKSKVDASAFIENKGDAADCQQLLDGLYAEDLLGTPKGAQAVTGFDDSDNEAQMRYQVAAYDRAGLDSKLAWMQTLPTKCDQFTAVDNKGGRQTVQVVSASPPDVGDARVGLQMTMTGELDGNPSTLTLDIGAVRVGDNGIYVTNGGLNGSDGNSTVQAVEAGTQRLQDVMSGKTPPHTPPAS